MSSYSFKNACMFVFLVFFFLCEWNRLRIVILAQGTRRNFNQLKSSCSCLSGCPQAHLAASRTRSSSARRSRSSSTSAEHSSVSISPKTSSSRDSVCELLSLHASRATTAQCWRDHAEGIPHCRIQATLTQITVAILHLAQEIRNALTQEPLKHRWRKCEPLPWRQNQPPPRLHHPVQRQHPAGGSTRHNKPSVEKHILGEAVPFIHFKSKADSLVKTMFKNKRKILKLIISNVSRLHNLLYKMWNFCSVFMDRCSGW